MSVSASMQQAEEREERIKQWQPTAVSAPGILSLQPWLSVRRQGVCGFPCLLSLKLLWEVQPSYTIDLH